MLTKDGLGRVQEGRVRACVLGRLLALAWLLGAIAHDDGAVRYGKGTEYK